MQWLSPVGLAIGLAVAHLPAKAAASENAVCGIRVLEQGSGWPVPLVQLRTTQHQLFVTDNAGRIAISDPDLINRQVFFHVEGHGYEVRQDGFGYRGVRLDLQAGETVEFEVRRTMIAGRLGRLTGAGLFAHSQRLGYEQQWSESGIAGCDSVLTAAHQGDQLWVWGDTRRLDYPLGIFHASCATTRLTPFPSFIPPLRPQYEYVRDSHGKARGVARFLPENQPTWLSGLISLSDAQGKPRLVATYAKIKPPLEEVESGLCVWNEASQNFEKLKVVWHKSSASKPPLLPQGHPVIVQEQGANWVYFGNPFPTLRCPATFEGWQNEETWQTLDPQEFVQVAEGDQTIRPHSGSIAWNGYRECWVSVFMQAFGQPSAFGELWYSEANEPTGPWGPAVKVLSHNNYTFYNPRVHFEFTPQDSQILLFEGTYTQQFAQRPQATPRYDYNQVLYRLDLDDPRLKPAQSVPP